MLKITDLQKTFNAGTVNAKTALDGLNLELKDGDFVTVIGGNGAGKSTLMNSVSGAYSVDEGKIFIDGKEVFSRENDTFHRPMHVVFDCEVMYSWVGEPDKSALPQVFSIDYFRYWSLPEGNK